MRLLHSLEQGFIYVHNLPNHIQFGKISLVSSALGTTPDPFDSEIETKQGTEYTISSIKKEECAKLLDFACAKKFNLMRRGLKEGMNPSYSAHADFSEDQHTVYWERMKKEGRIWGENDSSDDWDKKQASPSTPGGGGRPGRRVQQQLLCQVLQ